MSGTAHHGGDWLPVFLLAAFLVLTLGSHAAWPATGGGHGGGFYGGGHGGGGFPRGREFGGGGLGARQVPHEHHHDHDGRPFFVPYYYDPFYGYDPYYGYNPYYPGYPYDAYCDRFSPYYAPQYCYWDGP